VFDYILPIYFMNLHNPDIQYPNNPSL